MKLILVPILASGLFGYEIEFNREFSTKIEPDTLLANINISVKKSSEKAVLKVLGEIGNFISSTKDINKSGGNYSIHPIYRYEDNHRIKEGYRGDINYQLSSKDSDRQNGFISKLESKKRDKDIDISISSIYWIASEEKFKGTDDALRLAAFKWIKSYAVSLSRTLMATCSIKKASFSTNHLPYPMPLPMRMEAKSVDITPPTPEVKDKKFSTNPHFILECK